MNRMKTFGNLIAAMNKGISVLGKQWRAVFGLFVCLMIIGNTGTRVIAADEAGELHFDIHEIRITGNTLLPKQTLEDVTSTFTGSGKTAADVEKIRMAVEKTYREWGYPTVLVNIPDQNASDGVIELSVVEGRIRHVRINGNRYFTMDKIARDLPIFAPGEILYLPDAKKQLNKINMNPDLKVKPVLVPGRDPGTVDVELNVSDKLPLHGSLELNNRASHNTSALRANGVIHYDNLWQKEHSLSVQFQTSPEEPDETQALSLSYLIHAPWNYNHLVAAYGVFSDSQVAFGEGFQVKGKGHLGGLRYVMPLKGSEVFTHNVTLGIDYKKFKDVLYFGGVDAKTDVTPVSYVPLSFVYQAARMNADSKITCNAGLTLIPRGMAMDVDEYENKRFKARGNPVIFKAGMEYAAGLPFGFGLNIKADGQITDQPLVSNEQYSAGGMESVRGYKESEESGDNAVFGSVEIATPEWVRFFRSNKTAQDETPRYKFRSYAFFDLAYLNNRSQLPNENQPGMIQAAGLGFRGYLTRYFVYECDWGLALNRTDKTEAGDSRIYFRTKLAF